MELIREQVTKNGCPSCHAAVTSVIDSRSAEFMDETVYFEVVHRCDTCGALHVSTSASGGEADRFMGEIREMHRREGALTLSVN